MQITGFKENYRKEKKKASVSSREFVFLPFTETTRGEKQIEKIKVQSDFPFGIFRSWIWHEYDRSFFAYPQRVICDIAPVKDGFKQSHYEGGRSGDDFQDYKKYDLSDSMRHIHWKKMAVSDQLLTKHFDDGGRYQVMLDWDLLNEESDLELKISNFSYWLDLYFCSNKYFQVRINNKLFNSENIEKNYLSTMRYLTAMESENAES